MRLSLKITLAFLLLSALLLTQNANAQDTPVYDQALAKSLGGNENGMKKYVFVILKTGSKTAASQEETNTIFQGHMANMERLAKEGKLAVAGPFMKNDKGYRGIFILNAESIAEAKALTDTDPAVIAQLLEAEHFEWYGTAALMETPKIHEKIVKPKK